MSYEIDILQILQYATNTLWTFSPMVYLWGGAALAIFIIGALIALWRDKRGG